MAGVMAVTVTVTAKVRVAVVVAAAAVEVAATAVPRHAADDEDASTAAEVWKRKILAHRVVPTWRADPQTSCTTQPGC